MRGATKKILFWILIVILSCTSKDKSQKDVLTVAIGAEPKTLDPRFTTDAYGQRIVSLLFSSLVRLGPDLEIQGVAASSWTYDKEKMFYDFILKPNIKFSNGTNVSAEDILFSFEEYRSEKSPFRSAFSKIKDVKIEEIEGKTHVKVYLNEFLATLLTDLTHIKILPRKIVEKYGDDYSKNLIGSGSFKLKSNDSQAIELEAVQNHFDVSPKINTVLFKIIKDDNTRYLKTLKGSIDLAQSEIPASKIKYFEKNEDFSVFKTTGPSMNYLLFNLKDPLLKDLEIRKIFAHAINREEIIKYKLENLASPATSILTPGNPFFNKSIRNIEYSKQKAIELVEKHNLKGKEIVLKTSNNQAAVENGKVIANQLKEVGLNAKLQSFEWGTFYGDIRNGNFQIATMRWVGATDPDIYRIAFHSKELPPGRNRGYYSNPMLDQLLDEGVKIPDFTERKMHYQKVQEIVLKDIPTIPLWYDTQVSIVNKRVQGYEQPKNGDYSPLLTIYK